MRSGPVRHDHLRYLTAKPGNGVDASIFDEKGMAALDTFGIAAIQGLFHDYDDDVNSRGNPRSKKLVFHLDDTNVSSMRYAFPVAPRDTSIMIQSSGLF